MVLPAAAAAERQAEQRAVVVPFCQDRVRSSSRHCRADSQLSTGYVAAAAAGQWGPWSCGVYTVQVCVWGRLVIVALHTVQQLLWQHRAEKMQVPQ